MSATTTIEWADCTWNPLTGCTRVSAGCDHCYAATFAERFRGVPGHHFEQGFDLRLWENRLHLPLGWKEPRRIFTNSMSDLFMKEVPEAFQDKVFDTMERASWHSFQNLTKRSPLMRDYVLRRYAKAPCPKHIWLGVSIENAAAMVRLRHLQQTPAETRFLSIEPLIGPLPPLDLTGIHWVIVGGESGISRNKVRHMQPDWVRVIRDQCVAAGVPFFFKQWGNWHEGTTWCRGKAQAGRVLDGRTWDEFPR